MSTAQHPGSGDAGPGSAAVFARVLVGVDGTEPGFEACRQAAILAEPDAAIEAVSVVHLSDAIQVGLAAQRAADELQDEAVAALAEAGRILGARAVTRALNGFVTAAILHEIGELEATVVAIGSHGHRRATEILIGGVAGELLHSAPCSVLVARPPREPGRVPALDRRRHRRLARVGCGVPRRRAARRALRRAAGDRRLESRQGRRRREGAPARAARPGRRRAPRGRARRGGARRGPARSWAAAVCTASRRSEASPNGSPTGLRARCSWSAERP